MSFTADSPKIPGTYRHRWIDHAGRMREQTLFVGYTNARARLLQGTEPNVYMPRKLRCCPPEGYLHADRLTPEECGGGELGDWRIRMRIYLAMRDKADGRVTVIFEEQT